MATTTAGAAALQQLAEGGDNSKETTTTTPDSSDESGCGATTSNALVPVRPQTLALQPEVEEVDPGCTPVALSKKLLLCRRFKDSGGILRNFNSLPLFVYATSPCTHATSADGVGVSKEAAAAAAIAALAVRKNDSYDLALCTTNTNGVGAVIGTMDCLPSSGSTHHQALASSSSGGAGVPTATMVNAGGVSYQHHLNNLNHQHHHHHLLSHHSPYSNNYPLHHSSSHHHIHSEQTKSLQELQHEVGALLEFRDLVIETFPDLKHKMASISSSASSAAVGGSASVSGTNTLTGGMSNSSLASRREWEPGIRIKRKISQKEPSTSSAAAAGGTGSTSGAAAAGELSSSSLTRSRSNSHSGKKEPKSGENNNGSVVQDSGFSTETSSSKEGHSASSTNGAMTGAIASNRLSCPESDDELLNLLDVIHRKSNRLREEVEHLQNYERQNLRAGPTNSDESATKESAALLTKSNSGSSTSSGLTPKTFREHVERLNKEDIKQLRKERDRLLDKLAEMEAETLTGRIKATKMSDQVEELISVKKDLEEQLKLAMAQKLELSSRVQQLQLQQLQQQQQLQSKSSSSQSDYSSQRNFLSSATTVLSTGSGASHVDSATAAATVPLPNRRQNTFQPVVVEQQQDIHFAFHQSAGSDSKQQPLGRLDGIVSTPGARNAKCRVADSKRFTAILLETSVIELQRHLLTLTVQNQALMQKLEQSTKSKTHLAKRLDKSKEDVEDLRFQLEEKNIELEGTKAQLRVLESRIHSSTPNSGAATNSYLHSSQHDYETNRSSASTTLMLSRRGGFGIDSHCSSDLMRSGTPSSQVGQMPQPTATQISTPSMKAMVHLPMDEVQHHSSSTESAHDHELQHELRPQTAGHIARLMSTSVGGISPFEHQQMSAARAAQQAAKKLGNGSATSKPSKIPLPGSKAASYFAGKPPTGRPSTAGRSPPSANTSTGSNASSKSSLSRSTGNLLYSKSPNSLKRADSAQSIRKDTASSSLSTNTSRSSTSSSIPMATTPYSAANNKSHHGTTPSPRILQNSPLPKLKRESLTSRVRHLDSLSRVHQHNHSPNVSNSSDTPTTPVSGTSPATATTPGSYMVSSTPKPSSIAAQLNSSLRKDLQFNTTSSYTQGSQQFVRRTTGAAAPATTNATSTGNTTTRRFSSASVIASRVTGGRNLDHGGNGSGGNANTVASGEHHSGNGGNGNAPNVDSDSGKNFVFHSKKPKVLNNKSNNNNNDDDYFNFNYTPNCGYSTHNFTTLQGTTSDTNRKHSFNNYQQDGKPVMRSSYEGKPHKSFRHDSMPEQQCVAATTANATIATMQCYENPYFNARSNSSNYYSYSPDEGNEAMCSQNYSFGSFVSSSDQEDEEGSDNLLVTIDYGYSDSIDEPIPEHFNELVGDVVCRRPVFAIREESDAEMAREKYDSIAADRDHDVQIWYYTPQLKAHQTAVDDEEEHFAATFQVHRMQHQLGDSAMSLVSSYREYDVDELNECNETEMYSNDVEYDDVFMENEQEEEVEVEQFYDSLECTSI